MLIGGESGIGKSRLVRAFREELRGGRARLGVGYCAETGNVPCAPLTDALEVLGSHVDPRQASSQAELMATFRQALSNACDRQTVVLVVEDLHWADEGTLTALAHLLPAVGSMRVLLTLTYRSDELADTHPVAPFLARFQRHATRITLTRLTDKETRRLVHGAMGDRGTLTPRELDEIVERSEGNPFFAEELLKNVLERRQNHSVLDDLPLTIRGIVNERLMRLDEEMRTVASRAAILGRSFSTELLASICSMPITTTLAALRRLRDAQIVEESSAADGTFAFRHSLTRDVIYRTLLAAEVAPVHKAVLEILERSPGTRSHDLGYHAMLAHDAGRCRLYNERAGDEAETMHGYADAARYFDRAAEFAESDRARSRLLARAAAAFAKHGKAERAVEFYKRAVSSAEAVGDTDRTTELRCEMAVQARLAGDSARSEAILTHALAHVGDRGGELHDRLVLHLSMCKCDHADTAAADALIRRCTEMTGSGFYWSARRYAAAVKGDIDGVREAIAKSALLPVPSPLARLRTQFNSGFTLCVLGYDDEALQLLEATLPELQSLRFSSLEVLACANAALSYARRGDAVRARELVERGLGVPEPQTTGPIALAAAALSIAQSLGDDALVARSLTEGLLEAAFRCGIDSTLGRIAGPYARWLVRHGKRREANAVLSSALRSLGGPFGATETLLAAAEIGDAATQTLLPPFVARVEAMSDIPIYAATAAQLRALAMERALPRKTERPKDERRTIHGEVRGRSALTKREVQIARLVAEGTSNRKLAERLAVSQRTVEKHLTSIYGKLRVRSRSQLVALVVGERD